MRRAPLAVLLGVLCFGGVGGAGCMAMPSPLAPGQHGSLGTPTAGVLTEARELPPAGPGYAWFRSRPTHYGTSTLTDMIADAAAQACPSTEAPPLLVGDLSAAHGGRLPGHRSHRVGRDADLLFFYTTPAGVPVTAPGFVRVGADGLAFVPPEAGGPTFVRFDVARAWSLVRALVTSEQGQVLWIFISRPVEALLIEYARAQHEEPYVLWQAESILQQPTDSLPHDDHMHLRVACSAAGLIAGCDDGGPLWPWRPPPPALSLDDETLAALIREDDAVVAASVSMAP